jgi:citrate synthase
MTETTERNVVRGLKNVHAAETKISFVDPNGALYYLGYNINDLVGRVCYEEVAYLLLNKALPTKQQLADFKQYLFSEMNLPSQIIQSLQTTAKTCHPMDVLRTEVSHLSEFDSQYGDNSEAANKSRALSLVAKVPALVAALYRTRLNQPLVAPLEDAGFAENFLYMFRGVPANEAEKQAIDRFLTLHADHGFNASTFAARITASTNSDLYSAVTSAVGTLKGPLHGGASEKVMHMLNDVNGEEEVEDYIQSMLDGQKKIMGFGHRVYKAEDPRTRHLREIAEKLCNGKNTINLHTLCGKIENVVYEKKKIYPNVDFYAAVTLNTLGVPSEFFTPFFASSRISGWTAHVLEQYADAVLLRPSSKYVGEFGLPFVPIEQR